MEKVVPKMARQRVWMRLNPEDGELEPVVDDRKRCKKNSPFYPA